MMAAHGCGQRMGFGRSLGLVTLVALGLGGVPGAARACHLHHAKTSTTAAEAIGPEHGSIVHSQQILSPTSLVPTIPPLTTTSTPTSTPTATPASSATWLPSAIFSPIRMANSPAAEQIVPSAPPAVSAWHDASTTGASGGWPPPPPPSNTPVTTNSPAGEGINPPASLLPPLATSTPEPTTILSALVMVGAFAWRRRARRVD